MITHNGIRYWTTRELAASLEARGLVPQGGSMRERRRRARRWAARVDLRPAAVDIRGGMLWGEEETRQALCLDSEAMVP